MGASLFLPFALDRLTKWWALSALAIGDMDIVPGISLSLTFNRGISWGLFHHISPSMFWLLTMSVALVIAIVAWYTYYVYTMGIEVTPYLIIISGALSNILDRFMYGGVVDFIDCYIGTWHWPTFNIADSFIVMGAIWLMWRTVYDGLDT